MDRLEMKELFTIKQVSEITGLTESTIKFRQKKLKIHPRIENHRAYYTADEVNKIRTTSITNEKLDELQRIHPLVTNNEFFKMEKFSDVIPECFKDLEDE